MNQDEHKENNLDVTMLLSVVANAASTFPAAESNGLAQELLKVSQCLLEAKSYSPHSIGQKNSISFHNCDVGINVNMVLHAM